MISITSQPNKYDFALSPIHFGLKGSNYSQSNYQLAVKLCVKQSGKWEEYPMQVLDVSDNGEALFFIDEILSESFGQMKLPDFNQSVIKKHEGLLLEYFIKYAESFDGVVQTWAESSHLFAFKGYVHPTEFKGHDVIKSIVSENRFLNSRKFTSKVWAEAQMYLFWLNTTTTCNVVLKAKIYSTGTIVKEYELLRLSEVNINEILCIPAGLNQLNLSEKQSGNIYKYELYLHKSTGELLASCAYNVVSKPMYKYSFLYLNAFGVFDTALCSGQRKASLSYKMKSYNLQKGLRTISQGNLFSRRESASEEFSLSSGLITSQQLKLFKEFLLNNYFFEIRDSFVMCQFLSGKFSLDDDKDTAQSVKFKYKYSFLL